MRRRLREMHNDRQVEDQFRLIQSDVTRLYFMLINGTTTAETTGGGGGFTITPVDNLPPIPTDADTFEAVFWRAPNGDNSIWWTYTGKPRWYPWNYTEKSGEV